MKGTLKFNSSYFLAAIFLLIIEILIALFAHDTIIRPYFGDFLVVILIYCFVRSFVTTPVIPTAIAVLLFSFALETGQYFHIVNLIGLQHVKLARIIIGTSFAWADLAAYTAGILTVVFTEKLLHH